MTFTNPGMIFMMFWGLLMGALYLGLFMGVIKLGIMLYKALKKYVYGQEVPQGQVQAIRSLGQAIKEERTRCKMPQEFVAQQLGVSRQAVSKWENGTADPSTANLLALTQLFGVPAEELLRGIR